MSKITYYIFFSLICLAPSTYANAAKKHANKVDTCFSDLSKEYKKVKQTIRKIEKSASDNYLYMLPVYSSNYQIDTNSNTWKKLSSVINRATEEINHAETKDFNYCPNIAEIYKLKGIALFYQKKYNSAYEAFDMSTSYPNTASQTESYLWLARTSIYPQEFGAAATEYFLSMAEKYIDTNQKEMNVFFHNVAAEYYIQIKDYKNALEHLTKSINIGSPLNTRLLFIKAQIHEHLKCYHSALPYYTNISKKIFINNLMKSYSTIHAHLCQGNIEIQRIDSVVEQQRKEPDTMIEDFEPTIVESYQDSSFLEKNYPYYFNDYAAMFFLDESIIDDFLDEYGDDENYEYDDEDDGSFLSDEMLESLFENWESVAIHIPKTDFSNMQDTIYLPLINPVSEYQLPHFGAVVSRFGWRRYRYHYGTDTKGITGDSIFCVFDGVVRIAVRNKTYGNVIIVRHYNGLETFYAHCSKLLVTPNQEVKAGELIGLIGNTGRSKGAHLHFESRYKGAAFNPEYMIDFENKQLKSNILVLTKEVFNYKNTYSSSSFDSSGTKYHRVRSGETLSSIAKKYRTSVSNIKRMNGLKSDFIRDGQRLRIP